MQLKNDNWLKDTIKMIIVGIIINLLAIFVHFNYVNAETTGPIENMDYFPMLSGQNNIALPGDIEFIKNNIHLGLADYEYYFIYVYPDYESSYPTKTRYKVMVFKAPYFMEISTSSSSNRYFHLARSDTSEQGEIIVYNFINFGDGRGIEMYRQSNATGSDMLNYESSVYNTNIDYYANFTVPVNSINSAYWGLFTDDASIELPEFDLPSGTFFDDEIEGDYTGGESSSTSTTPPSFDSNLTPAENINSMLSWLAGTIKDKIDNLGQNLKTWFNNLSTNLKNAINKVIENIYNGFNTLINNIRDGIKPLLEQILEKLQDILDALSGNPIEDIEDAFENTTMYSDFNQISQFISSSFTIWSNTTEPSEFKIPLHLEQISILHVNQVQYIDFGLFSPVLPYLRGIMWVLTGYSLMYTIIDSIASYIHGGDE